MGELSEEILLILSLSNHANITDLKTIITRTLGYRYKSNSYLDYCIRRTCKRLAHNEILIESKGKFLTYSLSEKGRNYIESLESYKELMGKISTLSINNTILKA